jgi:hypothetical protein
MRSDSRQGDGHVALCVHPPERRRRAGNVAACGCCCCCCCLHAIGGLIGSAVAGRSKTLEGRRTTAIYWLCLLVAIAVAYAILVVVASGAIRGVSPGVDDLSVALLLSAMFLPAGQLGVSLIAGVIACIAVGPKALPRIWSITWRGFLGAVIGFGIMMIPLYAANDAPGPMSLVIMGLLVVSGFLYWLRRRGQRASHAPW